MVEAAEVIKRLLAVLPDSTENPEECWEWCWNELSDDSQERVKEARRLALAWLDSACLTGEVNRCQSKDVCDSC